MQSPGWGFKSANRQIFLWKTIGSASGGSSKRDHQPSGLPGSWRRADCLLLGAIWREIMYGVYTEIMTILKIYSLMAGQNGHCSRIGTLIIPSEDGRFTGSPLCGQKRRYIRKKGWDHRHAMDKKLWFDLILRSGGTPATFLIIHYTVMVWTGLKNQSAFACGLRICALSQGMENVRTNTGDREYYI